jgi:hypothetical protein
MAGLIGGEARWRKGVKNLALSSLIEHSFVNQLKGQSQLTFDRSGAVCMLDIPLESLKPLPSN